MTKEEGVKMNDDIFHERPLGFSLLKLMNEFVIL